jgi:hypothetical protein
MLVACDRESETQIEIAYSNITYYFIIPTHVKVQGVQAYQVVYVLEGWKPRGRPRIYRNVKLCLTTDSCIPLSFVSSNPSLRREHNVVRRRRSMIAARDGDRGDSAFR